VRRLRRRRAIGAEGLHGSKENENGSEGDVSRVHLLYPIFD